MGRPSTPASSTRFGGNSKPHQPIGALGDRVPSQLILVYLPAFLLIAGGAAVLLPRTTSAGAISLAVVYSEFAVFWLLRFYTAPHFLGFRVPIMIGLTGGVFMQLILVAAAAILHVSQPPAPETEG